MEYLPTFIDQLDIDYISHHGIKGMHWGVRRYQNSDGSLTAAGKVRQKTNGSRKNILNSKTAKIAAGVALTGAGLALASRMNKSNTSTESTTITDEPSDTLPKPLPKSIDSGKKLVERVRQDRLRRETEQKQFRAEEAERWRKQQEEQREKTRKELERIAQRNMDYIQEQLRQDRLRKEAEEWARVYNR